MKSHFQAPSTEALLAAGGASHRHAELQGDGHPSAPFEGQSTAHRDYQAPPAVLSVPERMDNTQLFPPVPFEGQSSMKAHYQATLSRGPTSSRQEQPEACNWPSHRRASNTISGAVYNAP